LFDRTEEKDVQDGQDGQPGQSGQLGHITVKTVIKVITVKSFLLRGPSQPAASGFGGKATS
jgi:hypothetical protein